MKSKKSKTIFLLTIAGIAICSWILIIWVYPAYHTARVNLLMNKTIQTTSSRPVEKVSSSDGKWILNVEYFGKKYDANATRKLIISSVDIPSRDFSFSLTGDYYPMISIFYFIQFLNQYLFTSHPDSYFFFYRQPAGGGTKTLSSTKCLLKIRNNRKIL